MTDRSAFNNVDMCECHQHDQTGNVEEMANCIYCSTMLQHVVFGSNTDTDAKAPDGYQVQLEQQVLSAQLWRPADRPVETQTEIMVNLSHGSETSVTSKELRVSVPASAATLPVIAPRPFVPYS